MKMASTLTLSSYPENTQFDNRACDRNNLLLVTRFVLRGLLEHCMEANNRLLDAETVQLQHLFVMVEKVLRHGLRSIANKSLITLKTPEMELWNLIEKSGKISTAIADSVLCIQHLTTVQSPLCRVRAWLRLAVMQKKLSDYLQAIIEAKTILSEYYEEWALMRQENMAVVFTGSLIALSVIDCNLCLREQDLDQQTTTVDLSMYIKMPTVDLDQYYMNNEDDSSNRRKHSADQRARQAAKDFKDVLDQKNYLEELNRNLQTTVDNLKFQLLRFDHPHASLPDGVEDEEMQKSRLNEMSTAMALMEKCVHEKQDVVVSLQQQVDSVKKINADLYQKIRTLEETDKRHDKQLKKSEVEKTDLTSKLSALEKRNKELESKAEKLNEAYETVQVELKNKSESCNTLQRELAESQKHMRDIEDSLNLAVDSKSELETHLSSLRMTETAYSKLKQKYGEAIEKIKDYEKSLEELGVHLGESKLKIEDIKEGFIPLAEAQWENDKETEFCKGCETKFSVSRRKHHCRNCGAIFCSSCSENTMPLPSSAKPVRVCDACNQVLLQRFSAKPETSS